MEKKYLGADNILFERFSVSGRLYVTIDEELLYWEEFQERVRVEIVFDGSLLTRKEGNPVNRKVKNGAVPPFVSSEEEEDSCLEFIDDNDLDEDPRLKSESNVSIGSSMPESPGGAPKQSNFDYGEKGGPSKKRKIDEIEMAKKNLKKNFPSRSNEDARLKDYNCENKNDHQRTNSSGTDDKNESCRIKNNGVEMAALEHHFEVENDISCSHCSMTFKSRDEFKAHYLVETDNHSCEECDTVFKFKAHLAVHRKLVHNLETPIPADDNPKRFRDLCNGNLPQSCSIETSDNGIKSYRCEICDLGMRNLSTLNKHMLTHTGEFLYKCCICAIQVNYVDSLKKHLASHQEESEPAEQHFCPYCTKTFESRQELKSHHKYETEDHPCKRCNIMFKYSAHLLVHNSLLHHPEASLPAGESLNPITVAKSSDHPITTANSSEDPITTAKSSDDHVGTSRPVCCVEEDDNGVKSYKCNLCDIYVTLRTLNLKSHMMTHTGENVFKCCVCVLPTGFLSAGCLHVHLAKHLKLSGAKQDFSCPHCSKIFRGEQELRSHLEVETTDHPCQKCLQVFRYTAHLVVHYNIVHNMEVPDYNSVVMSSVSQLKKRSCSINTSYNGLNIYECNICDVQLASLAMLNLHMMKHSCESLYQCCLCDFQHCSVSFLKRHMDAHLVSNPVECKLCKLHFSDRADLSEHQRTHEYQCSLCGQSFPNKSTRNFHYKTAHKTDVLKCHICGRLRTCQKDMELHLKRHRQARKELCPICGVSVSRLRTHTQTHHLSSPKPKGVLFVCDKCPKQYTSELPFKRHMHLHSLGRGPHSCPQCHKVFTLIRSLSKHMKIHTDGKPFVCEICGKSCNRKENLTTHMRVHRKAESVRCNECGAEFTRKRDHEAHVCATHRVDTQEVVEAPGDQFLQGHVGLLM